MHALLYTWGEVQNLFAHAPLNGGRRLAKLPGQLEQGASVGARVAKLLGRR